MLMNKLAAGLIIIAVFIAGCDDKKTEPKRYAANPIFTPAAGTYTDAVWVKASSNTEDATIRYTIDSSDPTEGSDIFPDSLAIPSTTTLKARAFKPNWNPSQIVEARYNIVRTVENPIFSVDSGEYFYSFELIITSTEGANIHYTTDNTEPNENSPIYSEPITVDRTMIIKARAYKEGWTRSNTITKEYNMSLPKLTFTPPPDLYIEPQIVTIAFEQPDILSEAAIYYTVDGNDPTHLSRLYTEPIHLTRSLTLKAIAYRNGWKNSEITSGYYDLDLPQVVEPVFDPLPGKYFGNITVSIDPVIPDAQVYYTTNGASPNQSSTLYTSPIDIIATTTIRARGYKEGWYASEMVTAEFIISSANIEMVSVPGGSIQIGDTERIGDFDESPVHLVTLPPFRIGKYPVKILEWTEVMDYNPASFTGAERPIENVSWYDAVRFCNRLSIMSSLTPVYSVYGNTNPDYWEDTFEPDVDWDADGYRLPTEAEWEYAARAATNDPDYRYSGSDIIGNVGWYVENSYGSSVPVGRKQSNALLIHDMTGNVWEWCWDWYSSSYYSTSPTDHPKGPENGTVRVRRGGSWNSPSSACRNSNRSAVFPAAKANNIGFRLVRKAE